MYFENAVISKKMDVSTFLTQMRQIAPSDFIFHVNRRRSGPNDKMESPINPGEYARIPVSLADEEALLIDAVARWRNRTGHPFYHLRVNFAYDAQRKRYENIDNLHFLAMFMQQLHDMPSTNAATGEAGKNAQPPLMDRLSVFLIPHTGTGYEFGGEDRDGDSSLYLLASQYLRLVAKTYNGVLYGYSPSKKVEALEFTKRTRKRNFFPTAVS